MELIWWINNFMNFYTWNNPVNLTMLNNALICQPSFYHTWAKAIYWIKKQFQFVDQIKPKLHRNKQLWVDIERDIWKCISIQTAWIQTWQLAHRSHICCVNLMTSSVSSVITTMILKEIDIDMRNKIVKIKWILEKPEHYKLWGQLLDWREWDISYLDIQSATVCNRIL